MKREELFELIKKVDDPVKDSDKILSNLHYTHFFLMDKYRKVLSDYDLSFPQANILGIIRFYSPKTVSLEEIKKMVLEPNSDVSRTVTRLVEKGLAEKVINKENRRKVCIAITPKGTRITKRIEADGKFKKFTSSLTKAEARSFVAAITKMREAKV